MSRWKWYAGAAGAVLLLVLLYTAHIRATAVWKERAHVADSTAKQEQKNRLRNEQAATAARAIAESLGLSVARLTREANTAAQHALHAQRDAAQYRKARDAAIGRLGGAGTQGDSLAALMGKSAADDSVIGAQERALTAQATESSALRAALDSSAVIRSTLTSALDSTRAQLGRDGRVIQQLQTVLATARPTAPPRFTRLALSVGVGYCAPGQWCAAVIAGPSVRVW